MALVLDLQQIIVWYGNRQAPYKDTELMLAGEKKTAQLRIVFLSVNLMLH